MDNDNPTTCSITTDAGRSTCGAPAVVTFVSRDGDRVYAECADHAPAYALRTELAPKAAVEGSVVLKTRSKCPFALVVVGNGEAKIVGYAHSRRFDVLGRAERLGAQVLPIEGGKVQVQA